MKAQTTAQYEGVKTVLNMGSMSTVLKPGFTPAPPIKVMINIGALMDIPTGTYIRGLHGEHILNGGLGYLTGIVGIGNNFKTTLLHYMMQTATFRMSGSTCSTYDTEINIHEWHLKLLWKTVNLMHGVSEEMTPDIIDEGRWIITDKTVYTGDEFYDILKDFMLDKRKNAKEITVKTPFPNRDGSGNLEILTPTFGQIDSFSEFSTQDVIKMQDENSLGESGANTVSMRQGLQKNRFLMEVPGLSGGSQHYMLMTAHLGAEFNMDPRNPAPKKLAYLRDGQKIKGAPEKFTFVMNNCWWAYNAAKHQNDTTKAPEYPRNSDDDLKGDTDLSIVKVRQLRNKSGPTGMELEIIVSQQDGVLPSLTEFEYIKTHGRFGLEGNVQNYVVCLCPEIKLSRTAIRGKIDKHAELRRALNICAEMLQMQELWHHLDPELVCTPQVLYADLKALGYDWDVLLNTRGWWAIEGTFTELPFLSTMDLMLMRKGRYVPYWMKNPPEAAVKLHATYKAEIDAHNEAIRAKRAAIANA